MDNSTNNRLLHGLGLLLLAGCVGEVEGLEAYTVDSRPPEPAPPETVDPPEFPPECIDCNAIVGALEGLRWELPCAPGSAAASSLSNVCLCPIEESSSTRLEGDPALIYTVELRVRGVVELKRYVDGDGAGPVYRGGRYDPSDPWNAYSLGVSEPRQRIFLNHGPSGLYYVHAIDELLTLEVRGGASITLEALAFDERQITNRDQSGQAILVPGVAPYPAAFPGQFLELTVLAVTSD